MLKKTFWVIFGCILLSNLLSSCLSARFYLDSKLPPLSYEDLNTNQKFSSLGVQVEYQAKGTPSPSISRDARNAALKVINKSNLFSSVSSEVIGTKMRLKIVINNTVDENTDSGYVAGMTFGAVGEQSIDHWLTDVDFEVAGKKVITKDYQQTILMTLGNKKGPKDLKPMNGDEAFDTAIEQLILRILFDLQKAGVLLT